MPLLLVIRSVDDMRSAIADSREFLAIQRRRNHGHHEEDRVLGVWLREDIDAGLPRMGCRELRSIGARALMEAVPRPTLADAVPGLRIGESTSLFGVWALCRVYSSLVPGAAGPLQRLRAVVHKLISPYSMNENGFFPVFPNEESPDSIKSAMCQLRQEHPNRIAMRGFTDDWNAGLIEETI